MSNSQEVRRVPLPFRGLTIPVNEWALFKLWEVINLIESLLPLPRRFRVCVWGTKRAVPGDSLYQSVFELCKYLAGRGFDIVSGGGPGVMEAALAGAKASLNTFIRTFGVKVPIAGEPPNPFIDRIINHLTFYSRLHCFVRLSSAFVVTDPGVGTVLEMLLVWQLLKEKHLEDVPLILVGEKWLGLLEWMDTGMVKNGHRRSKEIPTLHHVMTMEEAIPIIMEAHERFKARKAAV